MSVAGAAELRRRWRALPGNLRGAAWILLSCVCFAAMAAGVKLAGARLPSMQLVFLRTLFGWLAILPLVLPRGLAGLRTERLARHLLRAGLGVAAMACTFYGITHLPLADVTAIGFGKPIFVIPLAVIFLGEAVRWRRWTATGIGFLGVLVMLRPGSAQFDPALLVALLGTLIVAVVVVVVKELSGTETPVTILFYFGLFTTLGAALPAALVWRAPTATELLTMAVAGALATAGHGCTLRAYLSGEATAVLPFSYAQLLFAGAFGYLLFAEVPDRWSILGALIIAASTFYIARREAAAARRRRAARAERS